MGSSDGGVGESQNQHGSEWCEEDRCRLYEAKEGWRSSDRDFCTSETQTEVRASDRPHSGHRQEDDQELGLDFERFSETSSEEEEEEEPGSEGE